MHGIMNRIILHKYNLRGEWNTLLMKAILLFGLITLSFFLGNSKKKYTNIIYVIITYALTLTGFVWASMLHRELSTTLSSRNLNGIIDYEFMMWALNKFKRYAVIAYLTTFIIIIISSSIITWKHRKKSININWIVSLIISYRILLIIVSFIYSYYTINKLFDLASYIMEFAIAQCLITYLPLVTKAKWYEKSIDNK